MIKAMALCYALASFREARGEPVAAQIAVAKILQHRAEKSHKTPCAELTKRRQFAFVKKYGLATPNMKKVGKLDVAAWHRSKRMAKTFRSMSVKGITSRHVYFNTLALGKRYKTKAKPVVIGQLIFY